MGGTNTLAGSDGGLAHRWDLAALDSRSEGRSRTNVGAQSSQTIKPPAKRGITSLTLFTWRAQARLVAVRVLGRASSAADSRRKQTYEEEEEEVF